MFGRICINIQASDDIDPESVESYTAPVTGHIDVPSSNIVIKLKGDLGKMRKRNKPFWYGISLNLTLSGEPIILCLVTFLMNPAPKPR